MAPAFLLIVVVPLPVEIDKEITPIVCNLNFDGSICEFIPDFHKCSFHPASTARKKAALKKPLKEPNKKRPEYCFF
jgi:hypothetical protein